MPTKHLQQSLSNSTFNTVEAAAKQAATIAEERPFFMITSAWSIVLFGMYNVAFVNYVYFTLDTSSRLPYEALGGLVDTYLDKSNITSNASWSDWDTWLSKDFTLRDYYKLTLTFPFLQFAGALIEMLIVNTSFSFFVITLLIYKAGMCHGCKWEELDDDWMYMHPGVLAMSFGRWALTFSLFKSLRNLNVGSVVRQKRWARDTFNEDLGATIKACDKDKAIVACFAAVIVFVGSALLAPLTFLGSLAAVMCKLAEVGVLLKEVPLDQWTWSECFFFFGFLNQVAAVSPRLDVLNGLEFLAFYGHDSRMDADEVKVRRAFHAEVNRKLLSSEQLGWWGSMLFHLGHTEEHMNKIMLNSKVEAPPPKPGLVKQITRGFGSIFGPGSPIESKQARAQNQQDIAPTSATTEVVMVA